MRLEVWQLHINETREKSVFWFIEVKAMERVE